MTKCPNFILLYIQFTEHHLLKRLSFLHYIFLPPLSEINGAQVYGFISGFSFLFHFSICLFFVPVPCCFDYCRFAEQSEVRECDTYRFVLFCFQDFFVSLGSYQILYKFEGQVFQSGKFGLLVIGISVQKCSRFLYINFVSFNFTEFIDEPQQIPGGVFRVFYVQYHIMCKSDSFTSYFLIWMILFIFLSDCYGQDF